MEDLADKKEAETYPEMTADEFLEWDGGGHQGKMELVGGKVVAMSPASATHGLIQLNIGSALRDHIRKSGLPCRVGTETPVVPLMARKKTVRVPDIAVSCAKRSDSKTLLEPMLTVEVMSPSNERETWDSISSVAGLPSMKEVLVVQSTKIEAEVYRRGHDGIWPADPNVVVRELTGSIHLDCLDLVLPLADIYWETHLIDEAGPAGPT